MIKSPNKTQLAHNPICSRGSTLDVKKPIPAQIDAKKIATTRFCFSIFTYALCALAAVSAPISSFAQENENSEEVDLEDADLIYTSYFRAGHSLSLLFSFQQTNWEISRAGVVDGVKERSYAPGYAMRYGFHFSLYRNFGMFVGTSAQTSFEGKEYKGFNPGLAVLFPSMAGGFVFALSPRLRATASTEFGATWYPWMRTKVEQEDISTATDKKYDVAKLGLIPDTFSFFTQWDYFYSNTRALSGSFGWRNTWNNCLGIVNNGACNQDTLVERARIRNYGPFIQIGATWQPGDEL